MVLLRVDSLSLPAATLIKMFGTIVGAVIVAVPVDVTPLLKLMICPLLIPAIVLDINDVNCDVDGLPSKITGIKVAYVAIPPDPAIIPFVVFIWSCSPLFAVLCR